MVLHPRKFIKYLITENGIQPNPTTQTLITAVINDFNDALFSSFSPDGTKFFSCGISGKAQLFNFDRCSSLLSFDTDLSFLPPLQYEGYTGASFSYEGSKLYTADANGNNIYQFNLNAPNIAASKTLIFHNPYYNPSGGSLYNIGLPILAPDKKMYIFMGGGVNGPNGYISDNINTKVSVIQFPDNAGTSCGFSYQSFSLLETPSSSYCFYNTITNYDLGVLENSPCDTLGSTGVALPPTQTPLAIKKTGETTYQITTTKPTTLTLTDALGRQLRTIKAEAGNTTIDLNNYAQGVYFIAANGYKSVKLGR
jgi:WD40 repeat protein